MDFTEEYFRVYSDTTTYPNLRLGMQSAAAQLTRTNFRAVFKIYAMAGIGSDTGAYTEGGLLFEGGKGADFFLAGIAPERVCNESCVHNTPPCRALSRKFADSYVPPG